MPQEVVLELDCIRTQQILINLLSNALKFSKSNDSVLVKLELRNFHLTRDVELSISVSDTGIGIAESDIENIF